MFSGYQLVVESAQDLTHWCGGKTSYWEFAKNVTENTYFDLGSLTKVIATTSIIARLVDQNKLDLSSSLGDFFSVFENTGYKSLTLRQLLTHSSGLIAWHPFYKEAKEPLIDIFVKNERLFLTNPANFKTVYSDLGFLLLGEVLKSNFGKIEDLFQKEVVLPLQLKEICFGPVSADSCAATEFCLERQKLLQGEVFDFNTTHLGPVCSHAGLFSSAQNLLPWAREWLKAIQGKSLWLSQATAKKFVQSGQGLPESTWGIGWDTKSKAFSSAGDLFSATSFGHLGYPGTSIWIDPEKLGMVILLTNRVHPSRLDERIKRFRPLIHDCVAKSWESYGK